MSTQAPKPPNLEAIQTLATKHARVAGLSCDDAKDISHDVVQWFMENPDKVKGRRVYHVTIDMIRSKFHNPRAKFHPTFVGLEVIAEVGSESEEPYPYTQWLNPGTERAAFMLKYKWGMTHEEISEVLGIPILEVSRALTIATSDVERGIKGI